ncbi:MAG: DNA helicase RecQ [bacterium]
MAARPPVDRAAVESALLQTFGFSSFRPHQQEIVDAALAGRDVFAALPTGGGKSLCYQLPALLIPGLTVVVSPLIALMEDQVQGALLNGLPAAYLNSSLDADAARAAWRAVHSGEIRILYVAPERLSLDSFRSRLRELDLAFVAVDEAHCISEWGHEFRPDYRTLAVLRDEFPDVPIAAFTATATRHVQDDVIRLLGLRDPLVVRGDFDRKEIFYAVERKDKPTDQIRRFVVAHRGEPGIVYRATRKSVEQTAQTLRRARIRAVAYHAGLSDEERRENQAAFVRDEVEVVVATIAFGMGIDKSNVRWVLHGDLPKSLEAYYQETGRAGRDGEPAEALLLYGPQDLATIEYHIGRMEVEAERERARESLRGMTRYASAGVCRRIALLAHFDQEHAGECGGCDVCTSEADFVDRTVDAQKAMSAMVRTGERFGAHHVVDIVAGVETDRVRDLGHDRLPTFGVGADRSRESWLGLVGDLEAAGLVRRRDGAKSGLCLTQKGRAVLRGKESFVAVERSTPSRGESTARSSRARRAGVAADPTAGATDTTRMAAPETHAGALAAGDAEALFACLRSLRSRLAREQGVPPYMVFSDKSIRSMVELLPVDEAAFLDVNGVGDHKAELYHEPFTAAIRTFLASGECAEG